MDLRSLPTALARIGIPAEAVALGGRAEQCWCVDQAADGRWRVYWLERGNENHLEGFDSEQAACLYLLGRLTYSQLLAGVVGLVP